MFRSFCCLAIVAGVFASAVAALSERAAGDVAARSADKQYRIGTHVAHHHGTYLMWQLNRGRLGKAEHDEVDMQGSDTSCGSSGAAMVFEKGLIVRNFAAPEAGSITVICGEMFEVYSRHGGTHGRLGLPRSMPYVSDETTGAQAQDFDGGRIYWDAARSEFVVGYDLGA